MRSCMQASWAVCLSHFTCKYETLTHAMWQAQRDQEASLVDAVVAQLHAEDAAQEAATRAGQLQQQAYIADFVAEQARLKATERARHETEDRK